MEANNGTKHCPLPSHSLLCSSPLLCALPLPPPPPLTDSSGASYLLLGASHVATTDPPQLRTSFAFASYPLPSPSFHSLRCTSGISGILSKPCEPLFPTPHPPLPASHPLLLSLLAPPLPRGPLPPPPYLLLPHVVNVHQSYDHADQSAQGAPAERCSQTLTPVSAIPPPSPSVR
eukprot:758865-Hanusia_phi.AAC.2